MNLEVLRQQNKNEQAQHDNILLLGSPFRFITPPEKRWHPAIIREYLGHQSYKVQTPDGVVYCQSRLHLKPQGAQRKVQTKPPELNMQECPQRQEHLPVKLDL